MKNEVDIIICGNTDKSRKKKHRNKQFKVLKGRTAWMKVYGARNVNGRSGGTKNWGKWMMNPANVKWSLQVGSVCRERTSHLKVTRHPKGGNKKIIC